MGFEPPDPPNGLEHQPASPIVTSSTFLNGAVADDMSVCETAKIISEDIHQAIAERIRIAKADQKKIAGGSELCCDNGNTSLFIDCSWEVPGWAWTDENWG